MNFNCRFSCVPVMLDGGKANAGTGGPSTVGMNRLFFVRRPAGDPSCRIRSILRRTGEEASPYPAVKRQLRLFSGRTAAAAVHTAVCAIRRVYRCFWNGSLPVS